ncbi:MAG: hypothetical protein ABF876_11135 [Acetobacter aceti]|uniref:Uncharacterized protein n=1 Tax=Acetobacter aceti TaxID=435 RepID=A0A1U9KGX1_ACEAC|nr:hypothetical protein [Acetobacter aceti]AQS85053.1 hypothetical protein A0U92_09985 [Acetobacter aceti]
MKKDLSPEGCFKSLLQVSFLNHNEVLGEALPESAKGSRTFEKDRTRLHLLFSGLFERSFWRNLLEKDDSQKPLHLLSTIFLKIASQAP